MEATWWNFEFKDRITSVGADAIVALGPLGTAQFPIVRQSNDPNVRSAILSVTTSFFNQASVETRGIDFSVDYTHDIGRYGSLNFNLSGTKNLKYDAQAVVGGPVVDGNGRFYTASPITAITPNTDLRINGRVTWQMDGHNLTAAVRYYGPIDLYDSQTTLVKLDTVDAWAPIDLSYSYTWDLGGRELQLGVGAQNVFGQEEPYLMYPSFQPFIPTLHDTRGRSVYAKASVTF
ncbi:MAG: hypothetical protein EON57_12455 [Alphaproteobacteria bacterium]|nr:MAG: hypothetical protein EON57_12455 [Alphaproteobacteria bacterium]